MKYTLIKGSYHVVGQSPDADSIKFRAVNNTHWRKIDTENRDLFEQKFAEEAGVVTLRLEGIDAIETHFAPPRMQLPAELKDKKHPTLTEPKLGEFKQPSEFGRYSTNVFLEFLGVTNAKWRTAGRSAYITEAQVSSDGVTLLVKEKLKDEIPGYIVTGDIEKNGRPVAWIFKGTTSISDGSSITREALTEMVEQSANYHLLKVGMVYPLFFMTLPGKLRQKLAAAVQIAQKAAVTPKKTRKSTKEVTTPPAAPTSIWQLDFSTQGLSLTSLEVIVQEKAIYPYLFRKIIKHYAQQQMELHWDALRAAFGLPTKLTPKSGNIVEGVDLTGFFDDANPYVFVVSDQDFLRLDDILEISGNSIKLKKQPYDIVFLS